MIRGAEICPRITITKITISEKEMHLQKEQECGEMSRKTKKCGYRKRILAGVLSAVVALSSVQMPVTALHAAAWDQNKFSDSLKLRFWNAWKHLLPSLRRSCLHHGHYFRQKDGSAIQ